MAVLYRLAAACLGRIKSDRSIAADVTKYMVALRHPSLGATVAEASESIEFQLEGRKYVGILYGKQSFHLPVDESPVLFTSLFLPKHTVLDASSLLANLKASTTEDDVYHHAFASGLVIFTDGEQNDSAIEQWSSELQRYSGVSWTRVLSNVPAEDAPPHGPLLLFKGSLFHVFRRYEDAQGTLMTALLASPATRRRDFSPSLTLSDDYQTLSVLAPTRMTSLRNVAKPLAGLRMVIKDCWRMEGLRNTMENRAYYDTNDTASETAEVISKLIQSGAIPLGMTKLSCFAGREEPVECGDYLLPYNPRGDGYQSPAGSSNGSAAAVAAYDWIDFAIGTDTTGSGRRPAFVNGCFSLRPSQQRISVRGIIPTFAVFDTVAFLTRSLEMLSKVTACVITVPESSVIEKCLPSRLIYPTDYFPISVTAQMSAVESFVADLETSLGVKREELSIEAVWNDSPPTEAKGLGLREFLKDVATNSFLYAFYHSFGEFRTRYFRKHGKRPRVTAFTQWRWDLAENIDLAQHTEALRRLEVYRNWFLRTIMQQDLSNTVMVLPIMDAVPHYRDDALGHFMKQDAFDALFIAPILKAPELVVPIAQIPYHSRISNRTEQLPVAVSILGLPGTDEQLIETVKECLRQAGRPDRVHTGPLMFGG